MKDAIILNGLLQKALNVYSFAQSTKGIHLRSILYTKHLRKHNMAGVIKF